MVEAGTDARHLDETDGGEGAGWPRWLPGLLLAAAVALGAIALQRSLSVQGLSPLIIAVLAGIAIANTTGVPRAARPGLDIVTKPALRLGIVLLGAQLTLAQIMAIGAGGLAVVVLTVAATFVFTIRLGRLLGVEPALVRMIAAGTSICGASAVVATGAAAGGRSDQVATAIACVTLFGTVAMLVYPLLAAPLGLDAQAYGVWTGATVHEVAQAVAAGFGAGEAAGETATVTKLARVLMLLPVLLAVGHAVRREMPAGAARPPVVPGFVLGFAAVVAANSFFGFPPMLRDTAATAATFLMAMALAGVGMATDIRMLVRGGIAPLALGFLAFIFVATFGMMLVKVIM
jgi:uncharacterized integral membrane protein (TIGR00698 family)